MHGAIIPYSMISLRNRTSQTLLGAFVGLVAISQVSARCNLRLHELWTDANRQDPSPDTYHIPQNIFSKFLCRQNVPSYCREAP